MEVGFIGTGRMGLPMARHLLEAGHTVIAFDASPEALARATAAGAKSAASPAEVADRAETVLASLPTPDIVRAVAAGPNGVIHGKRIRRFVDLSTTGSSVSRQIAETLLAHKIAHIDSPVSGGVGGAQKGTLAVIVSGPQADFAIVEPLLARFGRVFFIGESPGIAQTMKLANNLLSACALAATSEAMVLAAKAGIDPAIAIDVINAGSGHNTASRDKFPKAVLPGTFDFGFANNLMLKDVRLGLKEAEALGIPMDIAHAVDRLFTQANDEIGPDKDFTTVILPLEKRAGVEVRAEEPCGAGQEECRMSGDEVYEVFAIRYAHHDRRSSENYIGGDPHDVSEPLDFFVWAMVGARGTVLLDTGFDEAMAQKRKRTVLKPIADGLKAIGVAPDAVETVIVSHLHYDHTGNYDLFPRARYHLQDCEMAYATGRCMCHPALRVPFEADDVVAMVRKVFDGRVAFHEGDDAIAPGITVHKIGGHSRGLQCVRVNTRRGPVVLASDTSHLYAHFEQGRVFPLTYNVGEVLEGYETLKRLAPSLAHIVPGHDPLVTARYPAAGAGLEGWVMRLDVEPKAV